MGEYLKPTCGVAGFYYISSCWWRNVDVPAKMIVIRSLCRLHKTTLRIVMSSVGRVGGLISKYQVSGSKRWKIIGPTRLSKDICDDEALNCFLCQSQHCNYVFYVYIHMWLAASFPDFFMPTHINYRRTPREAHEELQRRGRSGVTTYISLLLCL